MPRCRQVTGAARAVNPGVVLIAEPWGGGRHHPGWFRELGWWSWNDRFRDGVKGRDPRHGKGFIFGDAGQAGDLRELLSGLLPGEAARGTENAATGGPVNYLESHDGYTIGDFIRIADGQMSADGRIAPASMRLSPPLGELNRFAAITLLMAPGPVMLHQGQEFARGKVIAGTGGADPDAGKPDHNSYNKDDATNHLDERDPLARVASVDVKGAGADLQARTANLGSIAVREAAANLRREKDGRLNVERVARAGKAERPEKPAPAAEKTSAPAWRIDLEDLALERGAVALEDLALDEPFKLSVAPIQLKAEKLSTAKGQRGNVSLRATIDKSGTIAASGPLVLDPPSGSLRIDARTIAITPAQRYIDDKVNLAITSGAVSAKGIAAFELPPGGAIKASYKGDFGLTEFASVDKPTKQDLLRWKSLSLGAIDSTLEPLKVAVDDIALADFYARMWTRASGERCASALRNSQLSTAARCRRN